MKQKMTKAMYSERREALRSAIADTYRVSGSPTPYIYLRDFDESYAYYEDPSDVLTRVTIVWSDGGYSVLDDMVPVAERTVYEPIAKERYGAPIKGDTPPEPRVEPETISLLKTLVNKITGKEPAVTMKQFDDEQMIAYEPLYIPPGAVDGHGDGITEEATIKMVEQVKQKIAEGTMKANLFHKVETTAFKWTDAFVSPWPECKVGDQTVIQGQPVIVAQYKSKELWEMRKSGRIKGPSFGGLTRSAKVIEEDSDE